MVYYGRLGKKVEISWNKISFTGCQWSSLNAPGSGTPVSHSLLKSSLFPFSAPAPSFLPLSGVLRKGLLWEAGKKVEFFWDKISLTDCNWSCLNAPGSETPWCHSLWKSSLFPFSALALSFLPLSGVIRNGLLWEAW